MAQSMQPIQQRDQKSHGGLNFDEGRIAVETGPQTRETYANKPSNAIVVRRIHKLEPQSRHIHRTDDLHTWWLENSLPHLLHLDLPHETMPDVDARQLRAKAWNLVSLSAQRIVEIQKVLRPIVRGFERYRRLGTKLHDWCHFFLIVAGGSIGRFESGPYSDVDMSIIVESENFERCYEVIQGMVLWPLKLKLLEESIEKFDGQKLVTDRLVYCFDYTAVLPSSVDEKKFQFLRQLLTSGFPVHKTREFKRCLAPYYENAQLLPRHELAANLAEETRNHLGKLKVLDPRDRRFWRRWAKFVRLCVMRLALKHLNVRDWALNYFTVAELLYKKGVFKPDEWKTVQEAIVWALYLRENKFIPANSHQGIVALNSFQSLRCVTQKLLQPSTLYATRSSR